MVKPPGKLGKYNSKDFGTGPEEFPKAITWSLGSTDMLLWCGEFFVGTCLQRGGEKEKIKREFGFEMNKQKKKRSQSAFGTNVLSYRKNVNLPEW